MPTRRSSQPATPALTDADIELIREKIASGQKPRVVVRTPSSAVPAGTRGTVVRLTDPAEQEWIVLRLGNDDVPFSPSELSMPGAKPVAPTPSPTPMPTPAVALPSRPSRARVTPVKRVPAKKAPAPMTLTLRFADGEWSIEASRGAKRLAKPSPLRPGALSALAEHVADEPLRLSLVDTVEACRSVIEAKAQELRRQLDEAEASLKEYDAKPARRRS